MVYYHGQRTNFNLGGRRRYQPRLDVVAQGVEAGEGHQARPARRSEARGDEAARLIHPAGFISDRATMIVDKSGKVA
jgi:hypothetical protein